MAARRRGLSACLIITRGTVFISTMLSATCRVSKSQDLCYAIDDSSLCEISLLG